MIEKGKISAYQLGKLMYLAIIPTAILTAPGITFKYARQDLWISPLWAFTGVVVVIVVLRLHRLYPDKNFIQILEHVFGIYAGKVIGAIYWIFYLYVNGVILREYGEFIVGAFLRNTPLYVILGSMVLVCAMAVRGGVEIVGRFADLFLPAFIVLFLFIVLPIIPDLDIHQMLPVMGKGALPSIMGSFVLQIWFSELMTVSFLFPYVNDQHRAGRSIWLTLIAIMLTLLVSNLFTLLLLGDLTGSYTFPFLILSRYINLGDFFTHLESMFMAIWVLCAFVKICVFYYVTVLGAAQWMGLSDHRPIVWPLGFLLTVFGFWVAPNYQELTHAISSSVVFAMLTMFLVLPVLILGFAWLKTAGTRRS
jgi:spore germination protein KB